MKDLVFFLRLFGRQRLWLAGGIVLSLVAALSAIGLLTLSGWFITSSALAGALAADGSVVSFNFLVPAAQIRALAIARTLARYGERLVTHEATFRALAGLRCWFFKQVTPLAPGRLSALRAGDLLMHITADIDALDALYLRLCAPMLVAAVGLSAVTAWLYSYSPPMALTVFGMLLLASVLVPWISSRLGRPDAERIVGLGSEFKTRQIDIIQGMADLMASQAYRRYETGLKRVSDQLIATQRSNNDLAAKSSALTALVSSVTVLLVILMAAESMRKGLLSGPELASVFFCVMAAFELAAPLPSAMQMLGKIQKASARIRTVTGLPPTITEPLQAISLPERNDLTIDHVSFRYSSRAGLVLDDVSLSIPQGAKIAIIGNSGAGKTTLLQLLMRFHEPEQGHVLLAGLDYKRFDSGQLMTRFAVLSQRSQLFAATIKENLLLAKPDATLRELSDALQAAGLQKMINALPDGLNTWLGENGLKVSGGEARRIALARVYLKDAPILFLDEPTEGLDKETEKDVLNRLAEISKAKTMVMVTHRLAGLRLVDKIYRMEGAKLSAV